MSWAEVVAAANSIRAEAVAVEPRLADLRMTGIAWATVEAERAFRELATLLPGDATWTAQERDSLLGASVWRRDPSPDGGPALFVVEPDTEGRLAATLARFGEGVRAVYVAGLGEADRVAALNSRWGPYLVVRSRSG